MRPWAQREVGEVGESQALSKNSVRGNFPEDRKREKKGQRNRPKVPEHGAGGAGCEGKRRLTRWVTGS